MNEKNGILTGWNKIEADEKINLNTEYSDAKDIYDVMDIIKNLRQQYGLENPARATLFAHIANPKAHDLTINLDGDTVLDVLYAKFTSIYGNRLTKQEFISSMFNVHEIATREDYENQVAGLLMNLGLAKEIIDEHLNEANPHPELVAGWFPGEPVQTIPAISFQSGINTAATVEYRREGAIYCHGVNGDFVMYDENEIPVDYLTGEALTPMFGETVNRVTAPELLNDGQVTMTMGVKYSSNNQGFKNPRYNTDFLVWGWNDILSVHNLRLGVPIYAGEICNVSLYYRYIKVNVEFEIECGNSLIRIDNDVVTATPGTPHNLFILNNGWRRIDFTVKATENIDFTYIHLTKDGDRSFYSAANRKIAMYLFQVTKTATVAPPIPAGAAIGIKPSSMSFVNVKDRWSKEAGILNVKLMRTSVVGEDNHTPLFKCLDTDLEPIIDARIDGEAITIDTTSRDRLPLASIALHPPDISTSLSTNIYAFGYMRGHQGYGCTDNTPHVFDYYGTNPAGNNVTIHGVSTPDAAVDSPYPYEFNALDDTDEYALAETEVIVLFGDGAEESINGYVKTFNYFQETMTLQKTAFLVNQQLTSGD